ncbi:sugar transferase [Chitinophaga tropicalis]|uniref:Sugar transferase n=1 Tax=Chitinophaga tropicalis TaxID=2683588 RepID=A0A7K1U238_9BACT|nr:sugar transferase [Chitinophaga tropicalis]MVT08095.1 sugar transferase [Chitinophaga tropicalis]
MNTFTPKLNVLTNAAPTQFEEVEQAVLSKLSVSDNNILLFVGEHKQDAALTSAGYKCFSAPDFNTAVGTIAQLETVLHRRPGVIIQRLHAGNEQELQAWQQYLRQSPSLATPFFLYSDNISAGVRETAKKYPFIDEVISAGCLSSLSSKVNFIRKYKELSATPAPPAPSRQTGEKASPKRTVNMVLKRAFDITVSGTALVFLTPVFLVIAAIIKLESRGPAFYAARRAGKNYKVFKFYKFRTMVADADKQLQKLQHLNQYNAESGAVFYKVSNDPRVTRFGSFLRNTSLDELPQLFNVLIGDMSLVGNRPLPLYEAVTLTTDDWAQRFLAPAGITGLWQISKRGKKDMSVQERIELDINYSNKCSFTYDMWIMVNTPKALIQKDNV